MPKSTRVLVLHCFCLFSLVALCSASYSIKQYWPWFFTWVMFPILATLMVLTLLSWRKYQGCPLTKRENRHRAAEGLPTYEGSCMVHYYHVLTGRRLNSMFAHLLLVGIMLIPVFVFFLE